MNLTDLYHLRRALEGYEHQRGRDHLPAGFLAVVDGLRDLDEDIAGHLAPFADSVSEIVDEVGDDDGRAVDYSHAAKALGVTNRTIGRYAKSGKLVRVGRKVTRASLQALLDEGE